MMPCLAARTFPSSQQARLPGTPAMTALGFPGCGPLNRAAGVSVLLVVEYDCGPVAVRSGALMLPEPDAPLAGHRTAQAVREFAMATGPDHYRRAEELLARDGPLTGEMFATAQVHAMLALAAATALVGGGRIEADG
jgi:hypothetical protein